MRNPISALIDRRLEHLVVKRARRREPLLWLVPARWIVVATRPRMLRVRRKLQQHVLVVSAAIVLTLTG